MNTIYKRTGVFGLCRIAVTLMSLTAATLAVQPGAVASPSGASAVVHIDSGTVRGVAVPGGYTFLGLPYAAPPAGSLRWRPPQPVSAWPGVRDASQFGPSCPQPPRPQSVLAARPDQRGLPLPQRVRAVAAGQRRAWSAGAGVDPRRRADRRTPPVTTTAPSLPPTASSSSRSTTGSARSGSLRTRPLPAARRGDRQLRIDGPTSSAALGSAQHRAPRWRPRKRDDRRRVGRWPVGARPPGVTRLSRALPARDRAEWRVRAASAIACGSRKAPVSSLPTSLHCSHNIRRLPATARLSRIWSTTSASRSPVTSMAPCSASRSTQRSPTAGFARVPILNGITHDEERLFIDALGIAVSQGTDVLIPDLPITDDELPGEHRSRSWRAGRARRGRRGRVSAQRVREQRMSRSARWCPMRTSPARRCRSTAGPRRACRRSRTSSTTTTHRSCSHRLDTSRLSRPTAPSSRTCSTSPTRHSRQRSALISRRSRPACARPGRGSRRPATRRLGRWGGRHTRMAESKFRSPHRSRQSTRPPSRPTTASSGVLIDVAGWTPPVGGAVCRSAGGRARRYNCGCEATVNGW